MAIDTREKRQSAAWVSCYLVGVSVLPDLAKDREWRQAAGWGYSGIAAGGGAVAKRVMCAPLMVAAMSHRR